MADIVIKNVRVMQTKPPFSIQEDVDVVITGDIIEKVEKNASSSIEAKRVIDGRGKTLIAGNVCSHHHYYSGLSRGMLISAGPQEDFIQVLKEWWWRLDRGLDEEACYYSSLICSMDAICSGTTSCIDHHASPEYIGGSLSTIAKGMEKVGIRGATCYEVTDRNRGMEEIEQGVEENVRFANEVDEKISRKENVLVESMIGGHAPFTIPEDGMRLMKEAVDKTNRGMHLHIAEAHYDQIHSHHIYGEDIVARLDRHGLLSDKTLLVHGVWLNDKEIETVNKRKCFFAHNGRSNMNNHIGYNHKLPKIDRLVLGTDGCGGNMFEEIKIAFFKHKDDGGPWWPSNYLEALNRGNELVQSVFNNRGKWGMVAPGYKADLALLDYHAPTPLLAENAAGHFVWGMSSNAVHSVIVDGKLVLDNREFVNLDVYKIYEEASKVAKRVWKTVDKIKA